MGYAVDNLKLSKNTVNPGEQVRLSLAVITWDYLKKNYTWNSLKNSGMKWQDLKK